MNLVHNLEDLTAGSTVDARCIAVSNAENDIDVELPGLGHAILLPEGSSMTGPVVPGCMVRVKLRRARWVMGKPRLYGRVSRVWVDATALDLKPLKLQDMGSLDPQEILDSYKDAGMDGPPPPWFQKVLKAGPKAAYEFERVTPGEDPDDPMADPVIEALELRRAGREREGADLLEMMLQADLRCLDAHGHLGSFQFDYDVRQARLHFEVGVRIGELSLPKDFDGFLPWGLTDNRPFLRCYHGYALCLWRMGEMGKARRAFYQLLRWNPYDNQGAYYCMDAIDAGEPWRPDV